MVGCVTNVYVRGCHNLKPLSVCACMYRGPSIAGWVGIERLGYLGSDGTMMPLLNQLNSNYIYSQYTI